MRHLGKLTILPIAFFVLLVFVKVWLFSSDHSLDHIRTSGVIRIGYAVEAPYAFLKPDGEVTGESPEVAKWVVSRLEIPTIEWRQTPFSNLINDLQSRRIDVIASGMFITSERAKQAAFSRPTFRVRQGLLVAKGNPHRLHSYPQAVQQPGVRIAVISGSVEENLLKKMNLPSSRLIMVPDALTGRVAVESGLADGLALSSATVHWMDLHEQLGNVEEAFPFEEVSLPGHTLSGYGGFVFRKSDRQLLAAWDSLLEKLIGTGEHLQIVSPFGFTTEELPGNVTTEEVLTK